MQLHHHSRVYFQLDSDYRLAPEELGIIAATPSSADHPLVKAHSPFLFHQLPAAMTKKMFMFPFYVCGDYTAREGFNHAKNEVLAAPYGSKIYLVACRTPETKPGAQAYSNAMQKNISFDSSQPVSNQNHQYIPGEKYIVTVSSITLPQGVSLIQKAADSYTTYKTRATPQERLIGAVTLPDGYDHPYDQFVIHQLCMLRTIALNPVNK